MDAYKLNPHWAVRTRFEGLDGPQRLVSGDVGMLLRVAGALGEHLPLSPDHATEFEAGMKAALGQGESASWTPTEFQVSDLGYRDPGFMARSAARMRAMRNNGGPCFAGIEVAGGIATFTPTCDRALLGSHLVFSSSMRRTSAMRAASTPLADRKFLLVRPAQFSSFASVSSAPIALRVLTWLTTSVTDGLPNPHSVECDDVGRWTMRCPLKGVARTWGIVPPREHHGYYSDLFDTVASDLAKVGVRFKATGRRFGRSVSEWTFRFWLLSIEDQWTAHMPGAEVPEDVYPSRVSRILPDGARVKPVAAPVPIAPVVEDLPTPVDADTEAALFDPEAEVVEPAVPPPSPQADDAPTPAPVVTAPAAEVVEPEVEVAVARLWPEDGVNPMPLRRTSAKADIRPPWIARRFRWEAVGVPGLWLDRPIEGDLRAHEWVSCNGWIVGWDARPFPIRSVAEDILDMSDGILAIAQRRQRWFQECNRRDDLYGPRTEANGIEWDAWTAENMPKHVQRFEDDLAAGREDFEAHLPSYLRSTPRPALELSQPHDGLGRVDEWGTPLDGEGRVTDRSAEEEAYDAAA